MYKEEFLCTFVFKVWTLEPVAVVLHARFTRADTTPSGCPAQRCGLSVDLRPLRLRPPPARPPPTRLGRRLNLTHSSFCTVAASTWRRPLARLSPFITERRDWAAARFNQPCNQNNEWKCTRRSICMSWKQNNGGKHNNISPAISRRPRETTWQPGEN